MVARLKNWLRAQPAAIHWTIVVGLGVRVVLGICLVPRVQSQWFVPFLTHFIDHPGLDPWQSFLDAGGDPASFPYGAVMLAYFSLFGFATAWLPGTWAVQFGIFVGLLILDVILVAVLSLWVGKKSRLAASLAILSPIGIYASFIHGQLDLLPTVLIFASMFAIIRRNWMMSGVLIGIAVAAKFSSALVIPLVIIFLVRNVRYRSSLKPYLLGLIPGLILTIAPVALEGYRAMVIMTPTAQSVFSYAIEIGPGLTIVVLPVVYALILGYQYRLQRSNSDVLSVMVGLMLVAVTLLTPASPGWYVWSLPFLAMFGAVMSRRVAWAVAAFWMIATAALALRASDAAARWLLPDPPAVAFTEVGPFVNNLGATGPVLATAALLAGAVVIVLVIRESTALYDVYRLNTAPLSVAVAGDSGTGKDTVCAALSSAFGQDSTAFLMGDDYHRYDRASPLWRVTTHLHPSANDLGSMASDALKLMRGERIFTRHYDHSRGTFAKRGVVRRGDLVVLNGLHMLTSAPIRSSADLTVFMSMGEPLRRRLKIERDVGERGHSLESVVSSIERRYADVHRFIDPQAAQADLVLRLESAHPLPPENESMVRPIEFNLFIDVADASFIRDLHRLLLSLGNTMSSLEYDSIPGRARMLVAPDQLMAADIAAMASILIEHPSELFVVEPVWLGGSKGIIQLTVILALLERRKRVRAA